MSSAINKKFVAFHLGEAVEAAREILTQIEQDPDYEIGSYTVDMMHLYHHLNSAWNARHATEKEAKRGSEADFLRWRQYPADLEIA